MLGGPTARGGTSILAEVLPALPRHTCRASFVALFAASLLGRTRPWLCGGVAGWALTTALSRAAMGRHYLSDVLAGLLLGVVTVGIVTRVGGWLLNYSGTAVWAFQAAAGAYCLELPARTCPAARCPAGTVQQRRHGSVAAAQRGGLCRGAAGVAVAGGGRGGVPPGLTRRAGGPACDAGAAASWQQLGSLAVTVADAGIYIFPQSLFNL